MILSRILFAFFILSSTVATAAPWPDDLVFGRGGWWPVRYPVTVSETAPVDAGRTAASFALDIGKGKGELPLVGSRIERLRLTDGTGTQLVFSVWSDASVLLTEGPLPGSATIVVPAIDLDSATHRYFFYDGNPRAWAPTERYEIAPTQTIRSVRIEVGAPEQRKLAERGASVKWAVPPKGTRWLWRLPVAIFNASDSAKNGALVSFPVREAARSANKPVLHVELGGRPCKARRLGKRFYFTADIPARTAQIAYVYVREACAGEKSVLAIASAKHGLASDIPSEQVLKGADAADRKILNTLPGERLTAYPRNVEIPSVSPVDPPLSVARVSVTRKVFQETPVENVTHGFSIALAQNETEEFQLAVRSRTNVKKLEILPTKLRHASGAELELSTAVVGWVRVDTPSAFYSSVAVDGEMRRPLTEQHSEGWSGYWPDPIILRSSCFLSAGRTRAVRLTVKTSRTTPPGVYRGEVIWKADGKAIRRDALSVRVWAFSLPDKPEIPAIYDFSGANKTWWRPGEKNARAARERMWKFMAEKKLCPNSICENCWFHRDKNGRVAASFKAWDRAADLYFGKYGFPRSYMPENFWIFGWAHPPRNFLGEAPYEGVWPYDNVDRSKLRPEYVRVYQEALRLFWNHVKSRGLADRFELYLADEPYYNSKKIIPQLKALCEMIRAVDPKIRIFASTWYHQPKWNGKLDIWGIGHYGIVPKQTMAERLAAGDEIWWTTDAQTCLDTVHATTERLFSHFCSAYGAKAWENWGIGWLTGDPWETACHRFIRQCGRPGVRNRWVRYPNGDGYQAYPPKKGIAADICSSIRIESARDGVEDYSYLKMLEACAADAADPDSQAAADLLAQFRALVPIPNPGGRFSTMLLPVPEKIERLRYKAGELLSARAGRGGVKK